MTAIEIPHENGSRKIMFATVGAVEKTQFTVVTILTCDESFKPRMQIQNTVDPRTEEEYHKQLRRDAIEKGQFRKEYSTNPEWNDDYVEPTETE